MEHTLEEVKPRIFLFSMKDQYSLNMHFLRYQEFYESPSPSFRGKSFRLLDFMEWYCKKYGRGAFTYAVDWAGFNIPGKVLKQVMDLGIPDPNKYDTVMEEVYWSCKKKHDGDFYLIGARSRNQGRTLRHEIAHGFFYLNPDYRSKMTALVDGLPGGTRLALQHHLKTMGYTPKVYTDEIQAYMSTGLTSKMKGEVLNKENKPFVKLYTQYYKL